MSIIDVLISVFSCIFIILFLYQIVYMVVALTHELPQYVAKGNCRYAFLISAKNEENCIGHLIDSIKSQDYPHELFDVFVCADNCEDNTAVAARAAGAIVYERFDTSTVGKGYALDFLIQSIRDDKGLDSYDGYLVFDADNLLAENFLTEINKLFSNGHRIITSYRNSKNYDSNWISASTGMWFLREARHLNRARMILGVSCMVSGTGYVVHKDIIKAQDGWKYYKLTEDVEFSVNNILAGEKISYCGRAVFYDEQPIRFIDSWNQRLRWTKGFYQILFAKGGALLKGIFTGRGFACYDVLTIISPGIVFLANCVLMGILLFAKAQWDINLFFPILGWYIISALAGTYALAFVLGLLVTITEWDKIYCGGVKKILYIFTFPIFMLTYVPISIIALFMDVKWSQIKHPIAISNAEMNRKWRKRT
ncbi:MAG: glycosyltransferase [Lachnospiraceae bacterium]|nr:glycosyltransferase [Lachnospiraceae bacterium]